MSDLEQIKTEIAATEAELETARIKLAKAEEARNAVDIAKCRYEVQDVRALLDQQQGKENLLMKTIAGNFIFV
jgi:hypothetical protein